SGEEKTARAAATIARGIIFIVEKVSFNFPVIFIDYAHIITQNMLQFDEDFVKILLRFLVF
ncbi:MAG: hypothetical protein ACPH5M_08285, partial [Candidatus Puniceispirillaceae bacterium]